MASGVSDEIQKPADRLLAARGFVDVTKDQFALAPRVRRADDTAHARGSQNLPNHLKLIFGFFVNDQRPRFRQHGQSFPPPGFPLRPDFVRLGERSQVPDSPRHHVAIAMHVAIAFRVGAQHFGNVAGDRRLLGQNSHCSRIPLQRCSSLYFTGNETIHGGTPPPRTPSSTLCR